MSRGPLPQPPDLALDLLHHTLVPFNATLVVDVDIHVDIDIHVLVHIHILVRIHVARAWCWRHSAPAATPLLLRSRDGSFRDADVTLEQLELHARAA